MPKSPPVSMRNPAFSPSWSPTGNSSASAVPSAGAILASRRLCGRNTA